MIPLAALIYAGLVGLALLFLVTSQTMPPAHSARDLGPSYLPVALAIAMLVLIALDLLISRHAVRWIGPWELLRAVGTVLVIACGIWLATQFGFFSILPAALFFGLWAAGSRAWIANVAFSVGFPLALWLVFDRVLNIPIASL